MVHRMRSRRLVWVIPLAGAALFIGLQFRRVAQADVPRCGGADCPNCPVNSKFFGYYPTMWRRWPGTEPLPQPATPPATGGAEVPTVEPPPAAEEIETKTKLPSSETPAGPGGSSTEPGADPNAKRPMAPPGNGSGWNRREVPSPDAGEPMPLSSPAQINRLRPAWGNELAPSITESLGPVLSIPNSNSPTWPPPNVLRKEEIRASFQSNELPACTGSSATNRPSPEADGLTVVGEASLVIHERTTPAALPEKIITNVPAHADKAECDAESLHWIETPRSTPLKVSTPTTSAEPPTAQQPTNITETLKQNSPRAFTGEPTLPINGDHPEPSASMQIPFIPSNSIHDPLAPFEPRSLTSAKEPIGRTPADSPSNQLVPANRISEVPLPAASAQFKAAAAQPAPAEPQKSLSRIDPVAIGKSLESTRPMPRSQSGDAGSLSKHDFQFTEGVAPNQYSEPVLAPRPAPEPLSKTGSKSARLAATSPCFGTPPEVVPPQRTIEADFAAPATPSIPLQSLATAASSGSVTTADFQAAEPVMPAKLADVDPLHALTAPGTGFPPLSANHRGTVQRAVATISDGPDGAAGTVQPASYNRPSQTFRLPPVNQNSATGRSGEAFSSDAAPMGSASVSDSSATLPTPGKTPLRWGR